MMKFFDKLFKRGRIFTEPQHDYITNKLLTNLKERISYGLIEHGRICVTMCAYSESVDGKLIPMYTRTDKWTYKTMPELRHEGYTKVTNMPGYDSIIWWGVPIYVKLAGFKQFDIHQKDEYGRFIYSQDTAGTLHDEMISNATHDFMKGLFRTSLPTIDLQKLVLIAILGVGAFFGLMMMGII